MCNNQGKKDGCSKPYCKITDGECQFVKDGYESLCPMSVWKMNNENNQEKKKEIKNEQTTKIVKNEQGLLKTTFNELAKLFKK